MQKRCRRELVFWPLIDRIAAHAVPSALAKLQAKHKHKRALPLRGTPENDPNETGCSAQERELMIGGEAQ